MNTVAPPERITLHAHSGQLELVWSDAKILLDAAHLRRNCRCSSCRSALLRGQTVGSADVTIENAEYFGVAGLQLFFSDGHRRGVFPWAYLRELGGREPGERELGEVIRQTSE
jgi:DUF971 family protein